MKIRAALLRAKFYLYHAVDKMERGPVRVHPVEDELSVMIKKLEAILDDLDGYFYYTRKEK